MFDKKEDGEEKKELGKVNMPPKKKHLRKKGKHRKHLKKKKKMY